MIPLTKLKLTRTNSDNRRVGKPYNLEHDGFIIEKYSCTNEAFFGFIFSLSNKPLLLEMIPIFYYC